MKATQVTAILAGMLMAAGGATAPREPVEAAHERDDDGERRAKIIIRSDAEKQRRRTLRGDENENRNRQSEPDSERGLDRAEERRPEHAGAPAGTDADGGWYEYFFGDREDADKKDERDWYGYLFGRPKKEKPRNGEDDDSWWWPFD